MKPATELLLAAELIKRAEVLRDKDAADFAAQELRKGSRVPLDVLLTKFAQQHPYPEYLSRALAELESVADLVMQSRPPAHK